MQLHGMWVLYFCCNAGAAIRPPPLLGLCCSAITIVATSVILLLVTLVLMLFSSAKAKNSLYRPLGHQEVEAPRLQESQYTKVVRFSALLTGHLYPPGNIPGTRYR